MDVSYKEALHNISVLAFSQHQDPNSNSMNESGEGHYEKPNKEMGLKVLFVLLTYL